MNFLGKLPWNAVGHAAGSRSDDGGGSALGFTAELVAPAGSNGVADAGQTPSLLCRCLSICKIRTIILLLYF